ncbi:MAG: HEAT repeat domain-containing protein, partial [Lewinella sp.]|nr:HEAT repeat domain-containing protein [Lewinella sp.]
ELHELCGKYPSCSKSLIATFEQWQQLDEFELPEPSPSMHTNFYKMLSEMSTEEAAKQVRTPYKWWSWNSALLKWALIAGVFIMGVFTGGFFRSTSAEDSLVSRIEGEQEQKKRDYYAQLTSHSVTDRLQATQIAKQMEQLDDKIIDALFQTLIRDENVNVRLSAIETMLHFTDNPKVRESLIRAIPYQQAPLVQLTLAEVMTALKDKRAIEEIRRLLRDEQVELEVKMKLEDTIETLL